MVLNRVAFVGLLLGVAGVGACTSVRHIQPAQYLEDNAPDVVWVTYTDNTIVSVSEAVVKRDTLRGTLQGKRVRIPLAEVKSVQAKVPDHTKTAVLAASLGVATATTVYFMLISKAGPDSFTKDCANDGVDEHPEEHPECF